MNKIFSIDKNGVSKAVQDMATFCGILNNTIKNLKECGFMDEVTEPIAKELAMLNSDTIKASLRRSYENKAASIEIPFEKRRFMASMRDAMSEIDTIVGKMRDAIAKDSLHLPLRIKGDDSNINPDRLNYIIIRGGMVTYDIDKIKETYTCWMSNKTEAFVKKAKTLYKQLIEFDREVRLLSAATGNFIYGVGSVEDNDVDSIISAADGVIHLDLRLIKYLDCDNADELLRSDKVFNNSQIWVPES